MSKLQIPGTQDLPRLWRAKKADRLQALKDFYDQNPSWGYGPSKRSAPIWVGSVLSLAAVLRGFERIKHRTARAQNIEATKAMFPLRGEKPVRCFKAPHSLLELGRDARILVRADIAYAVRGRPILTILQLRKYNGLSTSMQLAAWGALNARALRYGDFKSAEIKFWDVSAPEKDAEREANVWDLAELGHISDDDLNAMINDVLDSRLELIASGYERPARKERIRRDEDTRGPDLFD